MASSIPGAGIGIGGRNVGGGIGGGLGGPPNSGAAGGANHLAGNGSSPPLSSSVLLPPVPRPPSSFGDAGAIRSGIGGAPFPGSFPAGSAGSPPSFARPPSSAAAPPPSSAPPSSTTATMLPPPSSTPSPPLWGLLVPGVERWFRGLARGVPGTGGALFPGRLPPPPLSPLAAAAASSLAGAGAGAAAKKKKEEEDAMKRREDYQAVVRDHRRAMEVGETLISNLKVSLSAAGNTSDGGVEGKAGSVVAAPPAKRARTDGSPAAAADEEPDAFCILDPSFSKDAAGCASELPGAILTRLTLGGLINALSGARGGVVDVVTGLPVSSPSKEETETGGGGGGGGNSDGALVPTAGGLTLARLSVLAKGLHRSVAARTEMDVMSTTPRRIADLLCPELTESEVRSVRRRVYDTVVLGQGTNSSSAAAALEDGGREVPVAAAKAKHELEQWKKCDTCGNNDQTSFVLDRKNGDLICTTCGTVVSESIMHEGSQFRKFEGEEDRNHHGDAPNPLFSNSHNMSTTLGGISFQTGAGIGGFGSGAKGNIENVLRNAHAYTEMNISQFGKEEKKTRIGYKDRQKKDAFHQMIHAGDALGLHDAVVQRAKELFAGFRDDRELVVQFKAVVAACLCESFDQLSRDGRQILKSRAGETVEEDDKGEGEGKGGDEEGGGRGVAKPMNARASRREMLHSASLAGKGGLLLGPALKIGVHPSSQSAGSGSLAALEVKSAGTWTLDDCKTYLIKASKSIARRWSEFHESSLAEDELASRNGTNKKKVGALGVSNVSTIPKGTKDELEGKLVEHTLKLCDFLESEVKKPIKGGGAGGSRQRVVTPRVTEMGRLGIKWQHSYERGSGGKGGVGNSGKAAMANKSGRTAGQILLLLTAKKFGNVIGDVVAGEAFHTELKSLFSRQEASKWQERRAEATSNRFKQMNRKPWLQAKAQL